MLSLPGDATHDGTLADSEIATKVDFGFGETPIFCNLSYASQKGGERKRAQKLLGKSHTYQ